MTCHFKHKLKFVDHGAVFFLVKINSEKKMKCV